jgi:transposase
MQWFVNLMEELGIECLVGHPAQIRAAEPRKQKHDRRDADLILELLVENRFPAIWLPSKELQDLRSLLRHRHQWVRMRTLPRAENLYFPPGKGCVGGDEARQRLQRPNS